MNHNQDLEELDNTQPSNTPQEQETLPSKPKPIIIIAAVVGLIAFVLPWLKFSVFGINIFSINGYDIPITAESIGYWSIYIGANSNGVTALYLLYLVPLSFALIIALELMKKNRWIPMVSLGILILLGVFLGGLIYNIGIDEALSLISAGIYASFIAAAILAYSKKM
ncbi:MAG: hypothetical protein GQ574_24225 [Crocinitomix sp.]|nr:hypothetical protein [Crocinitomix sp.]